MKVKKYNILKAALWYTVGNILIKGSAFFVLPIFTRLMSTHEYGIFSVYTSYSTIFKSIMLMGLAATVTIAKYAKEVDFDSYISTSVTVPIVVYVICTVGINTYILIKGTLLSMDVILWNCLLISAVAGAISDIIGAKLIVEGRYHFYMGYSSIHTLGNIGVSLALCYTLFRSHDIHLARVYGSTISVLISMIFLLIVAQIRFGVKRINLKFAFIWGIPLLFHILATTLLTQSDRILIRYMDTYSSAGIYAVATTIVTIPMVLQSSLVQAWTPWFYDKLDKKDYISIRWLNNRYIVLYGAIITVFILISPEIVYLFTSKNYWSSIYSLVPLSISVFGELLYSIPTHVEYYNKKTTYIMTGTLIAVMINIILDILFILWFGYIGASYATTISKLILFLMHYFLARRVDKNTVIDRSIVIFMLFFLAGINILTVTSIRIVILRYIIIMIICGISGCYIWMNKKRLYSYIRKG